MRDISLYIHIPFCKSKCAYCDFLSFAEGDALFALYTDALTDEIQKKAPAYADDRIATIFMGGGTPTILPAHMLGRIWETVRNCFSIDRDAEITMEANPESTNAEKLTLCRSYGVNRISFGLQSLDDRLLKRIGRAHNRETFLTAYQIAREAGFQNISLDLMYGLPGQNLMDFQSTLAEAVSLSPQHLSCYNLILEEGTPLAKDEHLALPGESQELAMYALAQEFLAQHGYRPYEISNYALPGYESRHNLAYWTDKPYLGLGLGAHSYLDGQRFHQTEDLKAYLAGGFEAKDIITLTPMDHMSEFMFLGLRKRSGVSFSEFSAAFGQDMQQIFPAAIQKHVSGGLLAMDESGIRLTDRGVNLSNQVFLDFLL